MKQDGVGFRPRYCVAWPARRRAAYAGLWSADGKAYRVVSLVFGGETSIVGTGRVGGGAVHVSGLCLESEQRVSQSVRQPVSSQPAN